MCRIMDKLGKVIAEYRSMKAMKEELEKQIKDLKREIVFIWILTKNYPKQLRILQ